jgi:hypothetical protein
LIVATKVILLSLLSVATWPTHAQHSKEAEARAPGQTDGVQERIVHQLISDRQLTADCVRRVGGAGKLIRVETQDLNRDGKPEYLIRLDYEGQSECSPKTTIWCYRQTPSGLLMLLAVSSDRTVNRAFDHFSRKKTYHNGFADLELVTEQGPYVEFTDFVFNGTRYVETKHGAERVPN